MVSASRPPRAALDGSEPVQSPSGLLTGLGPVKRGKEHLITEEVMRRHNSDN